MIFVGHGFRRDKKTARSARCLQWFLGRQPRATPYLSRRFFRESSFRPGRNSSLIRRVSLNCSRAAEKGKNAANFLSRRRFLIAGITLNACRAFQLGMRVPHPSRFLKGGSFLTPASCRRILPFVCAVIPSERSRRPTPVCAAARNLSSLSILPLPYAVILSERRGRLVKSRPASRSISLRVPNSSCSSSSPSFTKLVGFSFRQQRSASLRRGTGKLPLRVFRGSELQLRHKPARSALPLAASFPRAFTFPLRCSSLTNGEQLAQ